MASLKLKDVDIVKSDEDEVGVKVTHIECGTVMELFYTPTHPESAEYYCNNCHKSMDISQMREKENG